MGAIGVYDLESQIAALHANLDQLRNAGAQNERVVAPASVPQVPGLADPALGHQYAMAVAQSICPAEAPQLSQSKLRRWNIRDSDLQLLETAYLMDSFPSIFVRQQLASELGVSVRQVQVWFQNRRQRSRDKCREDGSGENGSIDLTSDINTESQAVDKAAAQPPAIDISQLLSRCEKTAEGLADDARPRAVDADGSPPPREGSVSPPVIARRPSDQSADDKKTSSVAAAPHRKVVAAMPVVSKSAVAKVQGVGEPAAPASPLAKPPHKVQNVDRGAPVEASAPPPPVKTPPTAVSTATSTAIPLAQVGQLLQHPTAPPAAPTAAPTAAPALAPCVQSVGGKRSRRGKMLSEARAPGMLDILMSQRAKVKNEAAMAQMMQSILASRTDGAKVNGQLDAATDASGATFNPSLNAAFGAGSPVLPAGLPNSGMPNILANGVPAALPATFPAAFNQVNMVASNVAPPSMPAHNGTNDRPHPPPQPVAPSPASIPFEQLSQLFQSMQAPPAAQPPAQPPAQQSAPFSFPMSLGAGGNIDPQAFAHACQELARMALSLASNPQTPPSDAAAGHRQPAYQPAYLPTLAHPPAHLQQGYLPAPQSDGYRQSQPIYVSVPPSPSISSEASYTMMSRSVSMLPETAAFEDIKDHASDRFPKSKRGRYAAHETFSRYEQPCPPSPSSQISSTSTQHLGPDFYVYDAAPAGAPKAAPKCAHMAPAAAPTDLSDEENDELLSHLSDAVFDALEADF